MYLGKQVYVHLVAVDQAPDTPKEAPRLRLEHVAFTGARTWRSTASA